MDVTHTNLNQATEDAPRTFLEPVADLAMCDSHKEELFAAVGRIRSPFAGVANWPRLEESLAQRSRQMLDELGEDEWRKHGGRHDDQTGEPTLYKASSEAAQVVRAIAAEHGGLLYVDRGIEWAVRLLPGPGSDNDVRLGLAVTWHGNPLLLDPTVRAETLVSIERRLPGPGDSVPDGQRQRLVQLADRLRLYGRAEQLLWQIYAAVRQQGCSVVVLADELLAQAIWAGHDRPKNWRQDLFDTRASLSGLCLEKMRILGGGWRRSIDLHSVAVASVKRLEVTTSSQTCGVNGCPLKGQNVRHGHFVVQVGLGFLGVLENYAVEPVNGRRTFDFTKEPSAEAKEQLDEARGKGQLVTVSLLAKIFGAANWSKLSSEHQAIIQGLVREITRPARRRRREAAREDGADVIRGNRLPGRSSKQMVECSVLNASESYVAFNGNGRRRGQGYRIVGYKGTGWLSKCGYEVSSNDKALRETVRRFLADLGVIASILGLTVVGFRRKGHNWIDTEMLQMIAKQRNCIAELERYQLRIYGPPDYHDRLRRYLEQEGRMRIPKLTHQATDPTEESEADATTTIRVRMNHLGMTQRKLAEHLGCTQQFVTQVLGKDRPWPDEMLDRAKRYVAESTVRRERS